MTQRVLMIDDDEDLARMLGEYLEGAGLAFVARHDVASGLGALHSTSGAGPFDAVILDVMLPDGDGFEVCRRIRAESPVPILMLTARGDETDRIVGLELGADDYLPKPFNPRELLARLRAILRRAESGGEQADPKLRDQLKRDVADLDAALDELLAISRLDLLDATSPTPNRWISWPW